MRAIGKIVGRELEGLRGGRSRGPVARVSRMLLRRQWRNWRHNGGRPRGRGYDWARTLVAEELLAVAQTLGHDGEVRSSGRVGREPDGTCTHAPVSPGAVEAWAAAPGKSEWIRCDLTGVDLKSRVNCDPRSVRREISRLVARGCVRRLDARGGRGKGLVVEIQPDLLRARVEGRLYRRKDGSTAEQLRFPGPAFQPTIRDPELAAALDSLKATMQKHAAEGRTAGETTVPVARHRFFLSKTDTSPSLSLPQPKALPPSAGEDSGFEKVGFAGGNQIANGAPRPTAESLRRHSRFCEALNRKAPQALTESLRRELMRHLRMACWFRGLDPRRTGKICGAAGWTSQSISKASKRKYLLVDATQWVHATPRDRLLKVSNSWVTMLGIAKAGFPRPASADRRSA